MYDHPIPAGLQGSLVHDAAFRNVEKSILALHAKAVPLFEYAADVAKQVVSVSTAAHLFGFLIPGFVGTHQYPADFGRLAIRLERSGLTLASADEVGALRTALRYRLLMVHMCILCAVIQLW